MKIETSTECFMWHFNLAETNILCLVARSDWDEACPQIAIIMKIYVVFGGII